MQIPYRHDGITISLDKKGLDRYTKTSYPPRYGHYSEVETQSAIYQFNSGGEIIFARGKEEEWPDRQEWLKRTIGNDWIYYSTGGYSGVYEAIGEFYLPNLPYPTNSLIGGNPFLLPSVQRIINNWYEDLVSLAGQLSNAPDDIKAFMGKVMANSPAVLANTAEKLFQINGGRVSVLPPDSRHVDYDIIPLTIATGCLYKCRFCKVKSKNSFTELGNDQIDQHIDALCKLYGTTLKNYNSVFLGEHDALCARTSLLLHSIHCSYEKFDFNGSNIKGANYFMFGSVDSFLNAEDSLFAELKKIPCEFYINIGLESADQETLDRLGKPIHAERVKEAFYKIQEINDTFLNIEISANFLMDKGLPKNHYPRFLDLARDSLERKKPKGCIYLSPLKFGQPSRELVYDFHRLKLQSRLPTFLYIIQRL